MKGKIIRLLKENKNNFISGQNISDKLRVSRTAVWKYINQLKEEGYEIESVSRKGYRLLNSADLLTYEEIEDKLKTNTIGRKIYHFDSLDSTNIKAKKLAIKGENEGTIIIGEEQTKGKGRLGRYWTSPKGKGVWLSIILRPNIEPTKASYITQIGAAAVSKAISDMGIKNYIKWPNDIVINNKKVCGILTEMSGEINKVNYIVIGMGINVNLNKKEVPKELKNKATSLKIESGNSVSRKKLVANILNNFEYLYDELIEYNTITKSIEICKSSSALINKDIKIIRRNKTKKAKAINLDKDGHLIVEYPDGTKEGLISGEISVRGENGYV
ncbi:MAG: biotin--[acetyl-CoA-carboxylase] ligase [Firmicutes bacterium]|nr:biotin--[acetyl-CoA-carboxylase] ligase [Bacillota bacterium]